MKLTRTQTLLILLISIHSALRLYLLLSTKTDTPVPAIQFWQIFSMGFLYDVLITAITILPFQLFTLRNVFGKKFKVRNEGYGLLFMTSSLLFFHLTTCICEIVFWREFQTRFNFIAVDYLVYTQEVIRNIRESYPLPQIFGGLFGACFLLTYLLKKQFKHFARQSKKDYAIESGTLVLSIALLYALPLSSWSEKMRNPFSEEVSKNGIYFLFQAYFKNELDYLRFYRTKETTKAFADLKAHYSDIAPSGPEEFLRQFKSKVPERKMNVVLFSMESMSAAFMNAYGSEKSITPVLDGLTKEGLFYSQVYATGTRTVRGLEALTLSIPPTPGQSILRRPKHENLWNIGVPFREKGYETEFLYGGYSYFDNMKGFFGSNGFSIHDRSDIEKKDLTFENAWGVCDGDLFRLAIRRANINHKKAKPFFQLVMTTSNHRPYTFPEGKIDLPSGKSGRDGAVKYSDYAIGEYLEAAKKEPWFKDTLFIFVADHNASVAGSTDVPVRDYRIPLIFYAPGFITPKIDPKLASQIDVAPTILGLLGFQYKAPFFGVDLTQESPNRSFVSNYQSLGYIQDGTLTLLSPKQGARQHFLNTKDEQKKRDDLDDHLIDETINYYQTASLLFQQGKLKAPTTTGKSSGKIGAKP
jgi:phosphoglycerol transferase MdoB-like AlkP superfamily enzyme